MPYNSMVSRGDAQALIPEQVSNSILTNLQAESAAMGLFTRIQMSTNQTRLPVLAALPSAYFVTGDTGLKQTTDMSWSNKYLNVEELAAIVPIPENVFDDLNFNVWNTAQPLIEQAIARALDNAIFFGVNKPSSWPDAIVPAAVAASHSVARGTNTAGAAGGLAADLNDVFAKVESDGYDVDMILANRSYKGRLRNARTADGVQYPELTSDQVYGVNVTYPLRGLWPTGASAAEVIVGNRREAILGIRGDMTMKVLDQAVIQGADGTIQYNLPQQDMIALRVVMRVAYQVANTINYDNPTEATRYPFAVLTAPAQ